MSDPIITVQDLRVRFGPATVVRNCSFEVGEGESFGLVGESGSGKSTILRTLTGLVTDWSGTLRIAGLNPHATNRKRLARVVQMVFQDPYASLHPRYVIGHQIAEPMAIHGLANPKARAAELLDLVRLPTTFQFRYPHELSGGQRQRVAIARALGLSPRILLLDEPTSALDVSIQAEILNLLNRLRQELGLTFVIVSHDLPVISYMCERLMVMRQAEPVEFLTRAQVRAGEIGSPYTRSLITAV